MLYHVYAVPGMVVNGWDWFEPLEFEGERVVSAKVDTEEKERMKVRIAEKLATLRRGGMRKKEINKSEFVR